jgi:hypothetical protein
MNVIDIDIPAKTLIESTLGVSQFDSCSSEDHVGDPSIDDVNIARMRRRA